MKKILLIIVICGVLFLYSDKIFETFSNKRLDTQSNQKSSSDGCTIDKVYYFENVLDKQEYTAIYNDCKTMENHLKQSNDDMNFAIRTKVTVPHKSIIYKTFYGEKFINYLNEKLDMKLEPSSSLPIEFRKYNVDGHMNWHRDVRITSNMCPQIEVVFVLENTSDSNTIWIDDKTNRHHTVHSKANSMLITQGDSVFHKVTPVTKGYRSIIKIAYDVL